MMRPTLPLTASFLLAVLPASALDVPSAAEPTIQVRFDTNAALWRVEGKRQRLELNPTNLACRVKTPATEWQMEGSRLGDLQVRHEGHTLTLQLATAGSNNITPYDNGFQTGLRIELSGFRSDTN